MQINVLTPVLTVNVYRYASYNWAASYSYKPELTTQRERGFTYSKPSF